MDSKELNEKRALTLTEAAEYACVSRGTMTSWIVSEMLPCEVLPGRGKGTNCFRRIRKTDLDEFLNKHYCKQDRFSNKENSDELILLPSNKS